MMREAAFVLADERGTYSPSSQAISGNITLDDPPMILVVESEYRCTAEQKVREYVYFILWSFLKSHKMT